ncbi:MAG: clostripain-related cysteine peptidase [Phocaeicola sp.]
MKKRNVLLLLIASLLQVVVSCSHHESAADNPKEPTALADYTIIMYGCGGGDLDSALLNNLSQVAGHRYSQKVNFTALVKYSAGWQSKPEFSGTRQYDFTKAKGLVDKELFDKDYRLDNPEHISAFIKGAQERMPAKKYILVLWNHGTTFAAEDKPDGPYIGNRNLVVDDNTDNSSISIFELEEALKLVGTKMDLVYWDVCLMNQFENNYQIKDQTHYILGAEHLTPGAGGEYDKLMTALEKHSEVLDAMKEYIPATIEYWKNVVEEDSPLGCDLTLCDMAHMEEAVGAVTNCMDDFIQLYNDKKGDKDYLSLLGSSEENAFSWRSKEGVLYFPCNVKEEGESVYAHSIDIFSSFRDVAEAMSNDSLKSSTAALGKSLEKLIPITECISKRIEKVSLGITWVDKDEFASKSGKGGNSLEDVYSLLKFQEKTDWARFLSVYENLELKK